MSSSKFEIGFDIGRVGYKPGILPIAQNRGAAQNHEVAQCFNNGEYNVTHPRVAYVGEIKGSDANIVDYCC